MAGWEPKITRSPRRAAGRVLGRSERRSRILGPIVTGNARIVSRARFASVTLFTVAGRFRGRVFYHWYVDGEYGGMTATPTFSVYLSVGDVARIKVLETLDPNFDPIANAPAMYGPRKRLRWLRSLDLSAHSYRVEQNRAGAEWVAIGTVFAAGRNAWEFSFVSPRLDDLVSYAWRVVPVTNAGNDGNALVFPAETVVRTPDAPGFTVTWDESTELATFTAA